MFYKKSKLSAVVLAQICLSTSVHAPIVTVSLLSGKSIFEEELQGDISIAQLTDLVRVRKQLQFPGELLASKPGLTINPTTRLGEIATDGHVSLTFLKYDRVEHILSGSYTIGVRVVRNNDRQGQYTLVLKGSDLYHEIDITDFRDWQNTMIVIERLNSNLQEDYEISRPRFTENAFILQSLLSDGMNSNTMELVRSLDCFKATNKYIAISGKSAYEMAIKEIHALEFVISQVAQKDPAEARPLQESINWIKHELDSRNTNDDLVNAIWFTYKRTQVLKDIYDLVELGSLVYLMKVLSIELIFIDYYDSQGRDRDVYSYDSIMYNSVHEFSRKRSNQYYLELPAKVWENHLNDIPELPGYTGYKSKLDIFARLSELLSQLPHC